MGDLCKEDIKLELGERAKDIIADGIGLKGNRNGKVICPLHDDKEPSMSWFADANMWRCNACQEHIDIYRYYTEFEYMDFPTAMEKVGDLVGKRKEEYKPTKIVRAETKKFELPKIVTKELEQPFIDYMDVRKITEETLNHFKVKQASWNGQEVYVFQYFNEKDVLEYVSYRGLGKKGIKGGCEKNTKSILWNMNNIDITKPVVITEGQPDAMAVYESGFENVVSVPNGSKNLKWIDHNWNWLQTLGEIIVFADNDKPGLEMGKEIKQRLDNVKVLQADKKDANEVLFFYGKDRLKKLIDDTIKQMPKGLLDLADVEYNSAMNGAEDTIETGFYDYDAFVEDWKMQELTVIFGRNGEGKTTFISQILAHQLEKKVPTFLYSGEMSDTKIQDWLYRQMIGEKKEYLRVVKTKYRDKQEPLPEVIQHIKEWHEGNLFLYDRNEQEITGNLNSFFNVMEVARKRYGVKLFVIDNLMAILEENADSLFSDQANFTQRCKNFAINNDCHIVLLAHPNKMKGEITDGQSNLDKGDISGSNNIPNKADNIIAIERLWDDDRECDAIISSLKDRNTGQRKTIPYFFSTDTLRFFNDVTTRSGDYGWEKTLDKKELPPESFMIDTSEESPF